MKFPVDLLADVSQMELERFAHNYMNNLLYSNPDFPEHLTLSDSTQVTIDISSVGFVPLYGSSDKQKILALFSPTDPFTAVALYLLDQWWPVDDILKTADPARDGALEVKTVGERIVLYILNRVIYRAKEMSSEELPFLCHGEKDHAKILWNNGQAVGFYSVKPTGSVYNSFSTRSYQLPVMDSIFVRKCQRGKGFGLQMLEDFVLSFEEDSLGFRYPLTTSMYKVCEKYLCQYPEDKDLLWEVEGIGGPKQRTNIASKIQAMEQCAVSKSLTFTEESLMITEMAEKGVVIEAITRSSGSKRRKTGEKIAEDKSEKVLRIEDIEAETPGEENVSAQKETDLHRVSELVQTEGMISVAPEERGEDTVDTTTEQDLEEIHVTSASMTEEPQVEDKVPQDLTSIYGEPPITVENVASEIEGPEEEDQREDTTVLVVSEEVLERHKEAETLDNVGEGTQIENTDEEKVTQQEVSLSTHASSEDKEALKAIKTVKSKAPRWRSKRQPNLQEGVAEKSPANDGRIVLRGRTVRYTPKRKYTQHSQKLSKEVENEVDEEEEENKVPTAEEVEGLALTEGEKEEMTTVKEDVVTVEELSKEKQQLEDEQLVNEEPGVEDTMVKASFIELPDKAETELTKENEDEKVTDESEREQKGRKVETSVTQDKRDASPDEIQEPPAVQKRALRGRPPKCKPTKQSKKHEKQEVEPTDEADQGTGGSASEESADQQPTDTKIDEHHKEVQEESVDKTEEKISTEELTVVKEGRILKSDKTAEDVIPSTEVNVEEELEKETSPAEETGGEEEEASQKLPEEKGEEIEAEERSVEKQKNNVEEEKVESAAGGESAVGDAEQVEDASTEEAAVLEEEDNRVEAADEINADTVQISSAEEEETTVTEECVTAAEVQSDTADVTGVADDATQEPDTVAAALETIVTDPVPDETVVPAAEEPQKKNINSEIPKLQKATIILVDIKKTCCHLRVKQAEEGPADGECAAPEKQQEEENEGEQVTMKQKSSNATVEAGTVEKEVLEEDNSEKEKKESAIVNEEKSDAGEALVIETSVLQSGKETVKSNRGNQQKDEDDTGEGITEKEVAEVIGKGGTDEVEGEMESVANYAVIATVPLENKQSEICADREADIPAGGDAEDSLPPAQVDKAMSFEQEVSVVETRALKCETKSSTATPRHRRTRGGKQGDAQEAENSEEPPVTTRTLRSGRRSASNAQKGKSRRSKKIQEDEPKVEEELKSFDEAVEKTDKEREGKNEEIIETVSEEAASERVESLQPEIDMEEGEAVVAQKQDVVEEQSETIPKTFAEREPEALGEECDESWKAGQAAAADDLVQGETDTPLPIPANDSATLPPSEEEATPSAEEQQLEENAPQLSDLRTMTVVLVDTKTKEEQREETIAQKNVCGSPELEKVTVEEQGYKDQVEIVTEQDTGEGRAEETAKEAEAKSANDDQEPSVTETRTQRNKKQEVKATPRSKVPRRRKKKTELEKEEALEIQKEEPAVQGRALRRGRMSILVAQRCSTKTTCKQLKEGEEAEDGEKSTEVQEREKEEKQQQFTHREKGEGAKEGDAAEQMENIDADIDKEETVTEEAVIQEDAPEEEQVNSTETVGNDNTEASVGQLAEGKTSDDAEEAVTTQDIDEREQPTSASKRVKSAAGEIAQETPLTAKDDKAKCVPQKEEASIIEKAQRSGEKTVRATGSKTTKRRNCQREEVTGEKSTEEDKLAVETRVLRKGRRSAAATDRRKSKRARTQCQTEEEGAKETSPAEETGVEEESPEEKEEEIEAEERKDDVKEEKVESAAGGESAVGDAEQVEDASTEEAAVLEEDNRVEAADKINADTVQISSAEEEETTVTEECVTAVEVESDTAVNEEEAEDASVAAEEETHQKDEDKEQNMSEDEEEPIVIGKRVLRGRSVPSVTITPRRRSAKVRKAEESLSDEEKNSSSARKRKTTEVTPTRTSKRLSRF